MIYPKPLRPGDTIVIIAPASCVGAEDREAFVRKGAAKLEHLGFHVRIDPTCTAQFGYLAGTDEERANAVTRAFADPTVDAVWALRGGYGCTRMLDLIDWDVVRANPKTFVGYSDITALHGAMHQLCDLATYHGLMPCSDIFEGPSLTSLMHAVTGTPDKELVNFDGTELRALHGGVAEGQLIGGNLSLLAAVSGSRYMPDTTGKLLFIEDVGEKVYIMDRYFSTLQLSGALGKCAGLIFGGFTHVDAGEGGFAMDELLQQVADRTGVPCVAGLQAGHLKEKMTLPFGHTYRLDADQRTIVLVD